MLENLCIKHRGSEKTSKLTACVHAAAQEKSIFGQCVLAGLEVARSGLAISGVGAKYRYLQPLTLEDSQTALTEYFVRGGLYSKDQMAKLLSSPLMKTQLALASGLPQLLDFLRQAMEDNVVREELQASEQLLLDWR